MLGVPLFTIEPELMWLESEMAKLQPSSTASSSSGGGDGADKGKGKGKDKHKGPARSGRLQRFANVVAYFWKKDYAGMARLISKERSLSSEFRSACNDAFYNGVVEQE